MGETPASSKNLKGLASACSSPETPFVGRLENLGCYTRQVLLAVLVLSASGACFGADNEISGITEPYRDVTLSAPVPGIINNEFFKEGEKVKQGDVILDLDKKLEEFEVARRKAVMDRTRTDLESTRVLVKTTKSVSKEELDKKETDYEVAAAEHGIAAEQLARRQIIAPFPGTLSEVSLHVGAACAPYQPLIRLVDTSRCYFVGHLEGKSVSKLCLDQPVKIEFAGHTNTITGKICYISPVVDPASGLAKVKAIFENADGAIRPGLAATIIPQ